MKNLLHVLSTVPRVALHNARLLLATPIVCVSICAMLLGHCLLTVAGWVSGEDLQ